MFPETKWHRLHPDEIEKNGPSHGDIPKSGEERHEKGSFGGAIVQTDTTDAVDHTATFAQDPHLGKGQPSKAQWRLYQPNANPFRSILIDIWLPWKMLFFPIVEFSAFVVSWSCSCFLTINLTQSQNFAGPPYNFDSEKIGFMNFAVLIGALIGLSTGGPFSDWVSAVATKRNRGIREPEMRLLAMSTCSAPTVPAAHSLTNDSSPVRPHHDSGQFHRRVRLPAEVALGAHRRRGLRLRRHPSLGTSSDRDDLLGRLLQTRRRLPHGRHHRQQERLGLRLRRVHHALGRAGRLRAPHHDQHGAHHAVVPLRRRVLLPRQELPSLDEEQLRAQDVECPPSTFAAVAPGVWLDRNVTDPCREAGSPGVVDDRSAAVGIPTMIVFSSPCSHDPGRCIYVTLQ
nr:putative mfs-type transporter [Quercus suber]